MVNTCGSFSSPVDADAWITRALPTLLRCARRLCLRPQAGEPEDHVQTAVLDALRTWSRVPRQDERSFRRWLTAILRNNVRDHAVRRRPAALAPTAIDATAGEAPAPPVLAATSEACARLRAAVAVLPADQRRAVELCLLDGMRQREVAAFLSRSEDAVQALLSRARRRLAADLDRAQGGQSSPRRATRVSRRRH